MGKKDPRIDAYIEKAQPFAKPIIKRLRQIVHKAVPEVQETVKWGHPTFDHKGIMFGVAAFKSYLTCMFWKQKLMPDPHGLFQEGRGTFTSVDQLPPEKVLMQYLKEAARLNEHGIKLPPRKITPASERAELVVPPALTAELKKNRKAKDGFEAFSYSHKKEYIEWIADAKTEETRAKRVATAMEWLAEGKSRNWKYQRKK